MNMRYTALIDDKPVKANLSINSGMPTALNDEAARRKLTRSAFTEQLAREMLPRRI
jgi:hypothetical protein